MRRLLVTFQWLVVLAGLVFPGRLLAQQAGEARARELAAAFLSAQSEGVRSKAFAPQALEGVALPGEGNAYLFRDVSGRFVLTSATDNEARVVGYGSQAGANPPAGLALWAHASGSDALIAESSPGRPIAPLLRSVRSQYAPYNGRCPYYTFDDGTVSADRTLVGCVATAMEQVIRYHQYPAVLRDTLWGWTTPHYRVDTIAAGTPLALDNILDDYRDGRYTAAQAQAVANLSYYCGIATRMNWGVNESGAHMGYMIAPLQQAFGYGYARFLYATDYTPSRWRQLLRAELEAGRPVIYAGYTSILQGHAFVIDGMDADGFYHINWGYDGKYDGYYDLAVLNTFERPDQPTETGRYLGHFCNQEMVVLSPSEVAYEEGDTLTDYDNVRVEDVRFARQPDLNDYVEATVKVHNISDLPATFTLELFTYAVGDTAVFEHADLVALTGGTLETGASDEVRAYCHFRQGGERVFAISAGDTALLYVDTLEVGPYTSRGVTVGRVDTVAVRPTEATLRVQLINNSATGWAGNRITYSLFEGDYTTDEGDWRQWRMLNLEPGGALEEEVTFSQLKPATRYTFVVRNPWLPAAQTSFTTPSAPDGVSAPRRADGEKVVYQLDGRRAAKVPQRGIYVVNGRKMVR